jgi:hypothetical protein
MAVGFLWVWALACSGVLVSAQTDTAWVVYHQGMDLREGLYANIASFRANAPTYPLGGLSDGKGERVRDLRQVDGRVYWAADTGAASPVDLASMWGFCNNNAVYIAAGNGFYRVGMMGTVGHLLYEVDMTVWDPYFTGAWGWTGGPATQRYTTAALLDTRTGQLLPCNARSMEGVLQDDPALLQEYQKLPRRKRDEALYPFLRRYNDRHPIAFPEWR